MNPVVEKVLEYLKPQIEVLVEKQLAEKFDAEFDKAVVKLKEAIPGEKYDGFAELAMAQLKPVLKEFLYAQAEKISDKV